MKYVQTDLMLIAIKRISELTIIKFRKIPENSVSPPRAPARFLSRPLRLLELPSQPPRALEGGEVAEKFGEIERK